MSKFIVTFHTAFGSMVEAAQSVLTVGLFDSYDEAEKAAESIWDSADRKDKTNTVYNDVWYNVVELPESLIPNADAVKALLELVGDDEEDDEDGTPILGVPLGNAADLLKHLGPIDDKLH
jgi:hypothetical protein